MDALNASKLANLIYGKEARIAELEAALKVAVDGLVSVKKEWVSAQYETGYQTQKMIASVTLAEIEKIAGGK